MPIEKVVKLVIEGLVFLLLAGAAGFLVAWIGPKLRPVRASFSRVVASGALAGFFLAELWAQLSHRERLGTGAVIVAVVGGLLGGVIGGGMVRSRAGSGETLE